LILLITGLAIAAIQVLFLAPATMLKLLFGQAPSDTLSLFIATHGGLLVGLVGALLVAELLAGQRLHEGGGTVNLSAEEWLDRWPAYRCWRIR
jgi:hypothetical protein